MSLVAVKSEEMVLKDSSSIFAVDSGSQDQTGIDISLLRDSLAKTPWERMKANDDALNFSEMLQGAMRKRHAESN